MQTRKFSLVDFQGGRQLSRNEMKQIKGAMGPPPDSCRHAGEPCGTYADAGCCVGYHCELYYLPPPNNDPNNPDNIAYGRCEAGTAIPT